MPWQDTASDVGRCQFCGCEVLIGPLSDPIELTCPDCADGGYYAYGSGDEPGGYE